MNLRRSLLAFIFLCITAPIHAQEVTAEHDFRGGAFRKSMVHLGGKDAAKYITPEKEGLRIRFAPPDVPRDPVYVVWNTFAIGDFEFTTTYEILNVGPTKEGNGVGVELYLMLQNANRDGIAFARQVHPRFGTGLHFNVRTNDEKGQRISKHWTHEKTTDASLKGRLRLARKGTEVIASVAEGENENFVVIKKADIGDAEVRMVRAGGLPGADPKATLDLRILDMTLTGDLPGLAGIDLPPARKKGQAPIVGVPDAPNPPVAAERGARWMLIGVILGGIGLLSIFAFVGLLFLLRTRSASRDES